MNEWSIYRTRRGQDAPNARMSQAQAEEYRLRYRRHEGTILDLAAEAGVSYSTMRRIVAGDSYAG